MKYPVVAFGLDPTIGLVGGKFVDPNPLTGTPASKDRAVDQCQIFDELQAVIVDGGGVPDETVLTQVRDNIRNMIAARTRAPNHFVDPCCRISQSAAPNLSTAKQYGAVDMVQAWASAGAVAAGTIAQDTAGAGGGLTPYSVHLAGVTLTGAAALSWRRWIESADAQDYINGPAMVACTILQNSGADVPNATITLNKANAANNFGAVTNIATSGNLDVPNGVAKRISFYVPNMGACGNGIEMITTLPCGAVVTKDFYITDFQISPISILAPFEVPKFGRDYFEVRRYRKRSYEYGTLSGAANVQNGSFLFYIGASVANGNGMCTYQMDSPMAVTPTITVYSKAGTSGKVSVTNVDTAVTVTPYLNGFYLVNNSGGAIADGAAILIHYDADARL